MGPDNRRILMAAAISVAILLGWQLLFPAPKPHPAPAKPAAPAATASAGSTQPAPTAQAAAPAAASATPVAPSAPEELAVLETEDFKATFTSHGGALKSYLLKSPRFVREAKGKTEPVDLVSTSAGPYPLAVALSPELGGAARAEEDASTRVPMRIAARDQRSVTFEGTVGSTRVVKTIALAQRPFELTLHLQVTGEKAGSLELLSTGFFPPDAPKPGFLSMGAFIDYQHPICRAGDKTERFTGDKPEEKPPGAVAWTGIEQFYFLEVLLPERPGGECTFRRGPASGVSSSWLKLPVDRSFDGKFTLVYGPKQLDLLKAHGRELDQAINYGYFAFFAQMLMKLLRWFQGFVHSWGIAIVLLTVTVKLVLLPLTLKSMQSMNEMRKLQPEMEKLREKFKDDKEQLNLAVMKMYQEHKVNPLGGCLPLLLQMPVFFALWAALQTSVELYREPFLWIHDLSLHDPIYVLPAITGISMFMMQKLSPQPADSSQAKMLLYFMPIIFTAMMVQLPAGLAVYYVINNLLSIVQQQALMKRGPAVGTGSPA